MNTIRSTDPQPLAASAVRNLLQAGRLNDAVRHQIERINQQVRTQGAPSASDCHLLGVILFERKDHAGAAKAFEQARVHDPDWPDVNRNIGIALLASGQAAAALVELTAAHHQSPEDPTIMDALSHVNGLLDRRTQARHWGEKALVCKDTLAGPTPQDASRWPAGQPLPEFNRDLPEQQVIAFSLLGDQPHLDAALANVDAARAHYPGWTCRFYVGDGVPADALDRLRLAGAQIQTMPRPVRPSDALFWRFLVAEDAQVKRFLVRDVDAVVNAREAAAVRKWLQSKKPFHLMRDHTSHTALMRAGMWGGVAGWLPPLQELLNGFSYQPSTEARQLDQVFLAARVWPRVRAHCLVHDSLFRSFGARNFPAGSALPAGQHVGAPRATLGT